MAYEKVVHLVDQMVVMGLQMVVQKAVHLAVNLVELWDDKRELWLAEKWVEMLELKVLKLVGLLVDLKAASMVANWAVRKVDSRVAWRVDSLVEPLVEKMVAWMVEK